MSANAINFDPGKENLLNYSISSGQLTNNQEKLSQQV